VGVITGDKKQPHVIDAAACIKCDTCRQSCRFGAVKVRSGIQSTAGTR
jgi:NADH-quinone oxidoreductase subunit F